MLNSKQLAQCALFIALISVSAHLKIPIGLVPITFQVLMITLLGLLLNRVQIIYVMIGYLVLGLIGLPVFASGAGIGYILEPSFGFIIGFILHSLTISIFKNKKMGIMVGYLLLYFVGLSYLYFVVRVILKNPIPINVLFISYWVKFLPSDLLSLALAYLLSKRLKGLVH